MGKGMGKEKGKGRGWGWGRGRGRVSTRLVKGGRAASSVKPGELSLDKHFFGMVAIFPFPLKMFF